MKIKTAIIMAGGRGERMRPLTDHIPKPLIKLIDKKSLILHVMDELSSVGIENFYITYGWLGEKILNELSSDDRIKGFINTRGKSNSWWVKNSILGDLNDDVVICPADLVFTIDKQAWEEKEISNGLWLLTSVSETLTGDVVTSYEDVSDYGDSFIDGIFDRSGPTPPSNEKASGLQIVNPLWLSDTLKKSDYKSWYEIWSELISGCGEIFNCRGIIRSIFSIDSLEDFSKYEDSLSKNGK